MTQDIIISLIGLIGSAVLGYIIGRRTSSSSVNVDGKAKSKNDAQLQAEISDLESRLQKCQEEARASHSGSRSDSDSTSNSNYEAELRAEISDLEAKLQRCQDEAKANLAGGGASGTTMSNSFAGGSSTSTGGSASGSGSQGGAGGSSSATGGSASGSGSQGGAAGGSSSAAVTADDFDKSAAKEAMGKSIKADDLKIVEGIGPKIESILKKNNIPTWKALSDANPDHIREILIREGGEGYRIHDPSTWPKQAGMAFNGSWKDLAVYQDRLKGGREV